MSSDFEKPNLEGKDETTRLQSIHNKYISRKESNAWKKILIFYLYHLETLLLGQQAVLLVSREVSLRWENRALGLGRPRCHDFTPVTAEISIDDYNSSCSFWTSSMEFPSSDSIAFSLRVATLNYLIYLFSFYRPRFEYRFPLSSLVTSGKFLKLLET